MAESADGAEVQTADTLKISSVLLGRLEAVKQSLVTDGDLPRECVLEALAAVQELDLACNAISDAGLKWSAEKASGHGSTYTNWIEGTRKERCRVPDALITGRHSVGDFMKRFEETVLAERQAVPDDPVAAYPHLLPGYASRIASVHYDPHNTKLAVKLAPSPHLRPQTTDKVYRKPLLEWHIEAPPSSGTEPVDLTESDVLACPQLARLLDAILGELYDDSRPSFTLALLRVKDVLRPIYEDSVSEYTLVSAKQKGRTPGWRISVRGCILTITKSMITPHIGLSEIPTYEDRVRPGAAPLRFTCRTDPAHMEEPSETLKGVVLACGRAAVSIVNAGTAMGKGTDEIRNIFKAFLSSVKSNDEGRATAAERKITWNPQRGPNAVRFARLFINTQALKVDQYFSIANTVSQAQGTAVFEMLKAECGGLWTVGSAFALLADLFKFSPTRLVQCLLQADAHGGSGSMPELEKLVRALPSSLHDHATAEERIGCTESLECAVCGTEYLCSTVFFKKNLLMCPTDRSMYAGCHLRGFTPLARTVEVCGEDKNCTNKAARDFIDKHLSHLRIDTELVCISLPIDKDTYTRVMQKMEACIKAGDAVGRRGFECVISFMQPREVNKDAGGKSAPAQFYLSKLVTLKDSTKTREKLEACGFSFDSVQAYRSQFHGTVSYDHFAAPRTMISTLDQSRIFFPAKSGVILGHLPGNVDVVGRHINHGKHHYPPEWVKLLEIGRFTVCVLEPLKASSTDAQAAVDRVREDMAVIIPQFSSLAALVPYNNHSRVVAKKNKTLCLQIAEAYKPIIAFGKRAGCADACYDLLASAKDKADDVYQPQVTTSESTFYTAAEMRSMDSQDVMSRVWTSGSQKSAQAFLSALKKEWHELFKDMLAQIEREFPQGFSLVGFEGQDLMTSIAFVMLKTWHYEMMIWWCDDEGIWRIGFLFLTFFVVNVFALCACQGRCSRFGFQLSGNKNSLDAFADAHGIHGLSMAYAVQKVKKVKRLSDIDLALSNLVIQSRTANYWLSNFKAHEVQLADAQLLQAGREVFARMYPELDAALQKRDEFRDRIAEVADGCAIGLTEGKYNSYYDIPLDHRLHPRLGNAHITS